VPHAQRIAASSASARPVRSQRPEIVGGADRAADGVRAGRGCAEVVDGDFRDGFDLLISFEVAACCRGLRLHAKGGTDLC
jgi:hypothetical protein